MSGRGLRVVTLLAACASSAAGQVVRVPVGGAEVGASYDGVRNTVAGLPGVTGHDFREWLALPFAGSLAGPELFSYQLTLRPTWQQRSQSGYPTTLQARQVNLAGSVRLLSRFPVNAAAAGARQTGTAAGGFGSMSELEAGTLSTDLFWRNRAFPMQLSFQRQSTDQLWRNTFAGDTLRVAQATTSLRFSATSSKLNLDLQRVVNSDRIGSADFTARSGNLAHTLRWGRGSALESLLDYGDQRGGFEFLRRSWTERLRLRHSRRTTSEHSYRRADVQTGASISRTTAWASGIETNPAPPLSVGLRYAHYAASGAGTRDAVQTLTPRLGVRVPLTAAVTASASGSLGWERRRRDGVGPVLVPVVDEPHAVDLSRRFTLNATDADPTSVVIRSADGTVVYLEGTDYALLTVGLALQIDVPPGSRIATGSTVLVSYRYSTPDTRGENATLGDYEVGLQARGLDLRHRRAFRESRLIEVGAPFPGLADFDDRLTSLTLRGPTPWGAARIDGALRQRDRSGLATSQWDASASFTPPPLAGAQLTLTAFWSSSRAAGVEAATFGSSVSVAGRPVAALFLRAQLDALRWTQTATAPQRFLSGALDVDWRFDDVEIAGRFELHRRWLIQTNTVNRATLRVVRRF